MATVQDSPATKKWLREKMKRRTRRNAAVRLAKSEVDRSNRDGLLECLEAGLPTLVEKYAWHSHETRSAQRMIAALNKM